MHFIVYSALVAAAFFFEDECRPTKKETTNNYTQITEA